MPITKQAVKKLRHDRARTKQNETFESAVHMAVKKARRSPGEKTISAAFATLDKAVKRKILHKNTASRTKSRLAKLLKK